MKPQTFVNSAILVATITVGITAFIGTGLTQYNVSENVDQSELEKLEKIENATSITNKAEENAQNIQGRQNFFTLPNVVSTLKLPFEAAGLWNVFIGTIFEITDLDLANWAQTLVLAVISSTVAFMIVRRVK